jgi:hypothetical protein
MKFQYTAIDFSCYNEGVMWIDLREPVTNRLLARFEPARDILEIKLRDVKTVIDLSQYRERPGAPRINERQEPPKQP